MSVFIARFKEKELVSCIQDELTKDVRAAYPDVEVDANDDFMAVLTRIAVQKQQQFVMIIDEWDAICREYAAGTAEMDHYVNWLRRMFKEVNATTVFACVYMTGILPIKKYKTESALNNFTEYSMVNPGKLDRYFGFTATEVSHLCREHNMDYDEMAKWYDGYKLGGEPSMFNPNSVMMALWEGRCRSFWASTGSYDAVAAYIQMNFDGLKDDVIKMLAGGRCVVDPTGFQNDMSVINSKNDALTVLIHLGYLAYEWETSECYSPNREVEGELINAVNSTNWQQLISSIEQSRKLIQATLDGDEQAVAKAIDAAHDENTSILSYNNENSLACVLSIAYYYARNDYVIVRELPTGKGFADLVLIPRKRIDKPAILLELKYDKAADAAIDQIKRKEYAGKVRQLTGNVILVGINYDKASKKHTCSIEHVLI